MVIENCLWSNGYIGLQVRVKVRARDRKWILLSFLKSDKHLVLPSKCDVMRFSPCA